MSWLLSGSRRTIAPPPPQPRGGTTALAGERTAGFKVGAAQGELRCPTTDALFAQEVERKVSNLLAGLTASSIAPRRSLKLLNPLPAHRSSNPPCPGQRTRTSM